MLELKRHTDELISRLAVDHTAAGGPDLSGDGQVQVGVFDRPPIDRDFVGVAPRGFVDADEPTMTSWGREYTIDFRAFARSTQDQPRERMEAAVAMAEGLVTAIEGALYAIGDLELADRAWDYRIRRLDVLDLMETGLAGAWGLVTGELVYRVQSNDEVP